MKVFILSMLIGPEKRLCGVFSSTDKVEDFKRIHPASEYSNYGGYEVECCELDGGTETKL